MPHPDGLGDLVRTLRLAARLSQEALAERAGLSARAVSDIERGTSRPRPITLSLLEEALGLGASAREQLRNVGQAPGHDPAKAEPAWAEPERLLGRTAELGRARAAIVEHTARLVTFLGGPGVGKTALAHAVARELSAAFDETVLLDLVAVPGPDLVPLKVALASGAQLARGDSVARTIAETIDGRSVLFVLDTFEHVAASAPFLAELLAIAPGAVIVVTSRVALRLPNEFVVTVEPLQVTDAVELLVARAAVAGRFVRSDASDGAIARLVAMLEGVPLAIELAAPLLAVASRGSGRKARTAPPAAECVEQRKRVEPSDDARCNRVELRFVVRKRAAPVSGLSGLPRQLWSRRRSGHRDRRWAGSALGNVTTTRGARASKSVAERIRGRLAPARVLGVHAGVRC